MCKGKESKHYIGHRARLFKRVLHNIEHVEEYEIIEALLTFVQPRRDVKKQAKDIIAYTGTIKDMVEQSPLSYTHINGVGEHMSWYCALLAEIANRYANRIPVYSTKTSDMSNNTAYKIGSITSFIELKEYLESYKIYTYTPCNYIIYMNNKREVISMEHCFFDERISDFIQHIVSMHPSGIILVKKVDDEQYVLNKHDVELLKKLEKGLYLFGIVLLDYVVCTKSKMISLQQYSLLQFKDSHTS